MNEFKFPLAAAITTLASFYFASQGKDSALVETAKTLVSTALDHAGDPLNDCVLLEAPKPKKVKKVTKKVTAS